MNALSSAVTLADLEERARRRLPRLVADFIDGGAEDERTLRSNREAFARYTLSTRLLGSAQQRDTSVTVAGRRLEMPVMLAPTGLSRIAGRGGEIAAARAADLAGSVAVVSSASSHSIGDVAAATSAPPWFQLYPWGDRELTDALLARARNAGVETLVVTLDVPVTGARERDLRNGFTAPVRVTAATAVDVLRHPRWVTRVLAPDYLRGDPITLANLVGLRPGHRTNAASLAELNLSLVNADYSWDDLRRVRDSWDGPFFVKGVLSASDARTCRTAGATGVIVSNHGGRQADGVPATLDVLPEVVAAAGGTLEVLVDGGFRRGTDVVTALALGADAVLVGRPWMHGLAVGGESGVRHVLTTLRTEIDRTLALVGAVSVRDLDRSYLRDATGRPLPDPPLDDPEPTP